MPTQDVARRILGSGWWARFTLNGITRYDQGAYGLVGGAEGRGSGALLPAPGILAAVQGDHQDFRALLTEIRGMGELPQHESRICP